MKKTKMILTVIVLIVSTWLAKGQSCSSSSCNVASCEKVCNGSFEYNIGNPTTISYPSAQQTTLVCGWSNYDNGGCGFGPTTADYMTTSGGASVGIACNIAGTEAARTGTAYIGVIAYSSAGVHGTPGCWFESVSTILSNTLTAGKVYQLTYYLSLGDICDYNTDDNMGAAILWTANPSGTKITQTVSTSGVIRNGWTQVSMTFTSAGVEDALVIGAMQQATSRTPATTPTTNCMYIDHATNNDTYYYIEDVSLVEVTNMSVTASATTGCTGETFTLTASGANTYTWLPVDNFAGSNSASVAVTPTTTLTYTVTGSSSAGCYVPSQTISIAPYSCCANPASGNITLRDVKLVPYGTSGAQPWASLTSGGFYTGTIAIPSNSIITNTLTIVNTLSVCATLTFNTCNMVICEDDVIQQYSVTTIDHCLLKGDLNTLWEGIWHYGTSLDITNSWIEDAYIAVNMGNSFSMLSSPTRLYVDNVMFNKNYYGLATSSFTMDPGNFSIKGSIFTSKSGWTPDYTTSTRYTSTYNPANRPGTKIKGSTTHSITNSTIRSNIGVDIAGSVSNNANPFFSVGETSSTATLNASYTNRFDYLNIGILNVNSKVNVYNNGFSNISTVSSGTALGAVYHLSFFGLAYTNVGANPASQYKNVFGVNCTGSIQDGVTAVNGGSINVSYNDFCTISRYGVNVQTWNDATSSHSVVVSNNTFSTTSYAFYANNNQTITASITSNTLVQTQPTYTSSGYGVYINEINKPANAHYLINDNNFSQGLNSIYITNTKNARVIDNLISIKKPSSTSIFNGGIWLDNTENCFIKGNTISCNPTNSSSWNTFGIFESASPYTTLKCNTIYSVSACIKAQSTCSPTTMYYNSLNNTSGHDPCSYGLWLDQSATFGDIGYYNTSSSTWEMSDDIWGDFINGDTECSSSSNPNTSPAYKIYYDNSNSGPKPLSLYQPQVNLNTFGGTDISQSFSPTANSTANSQNCNDVSRLINPTQTNPGRNIGSIPTLGYNNSVSLSSGNENADNVNNGHLSSHKKQIILKTYDPNGRVIANNEDAFLVVDSLMTLYTQTKNNAVISSAISTNASINAVNVIEQNQKDFNGIYCVFLQGDSLVSSSQIQDITNMAALCPYVDGFAVYQARALVRNWDDSTHYYNVCENNTPDLNNANARFASNSTVTLETQPVVYPNPTSGSLMVKSSCKNCIFEVYDIIGKKVLSQKLNENETKIDLNSLNNGTYLFKIMQEGIILKADKLLLNK